MRPSELRRHERRSWIGFAAICLASLLAVVLASLAAAHLGEPRRRSDTETATATPRGPAPQFVLRGFASDLRDTARRVQRTLETARQVEIGGAVAFLQGGVRLGEYIQPLEDGTELLLLVLYRSDGASQAQPASAANARPRGRVVLDVYRREGGTWQLFHGNLFHEDYEPGTESVLTSEGVTLRKAGAGIIAVDIPLRRRCDPTLQSDLARRRSVYLELDLSPRVLTAFVSAGARGNRTDDRLEAILTFSELDGTQGRGELTAVRRYPDEAFPETWSVGFAMSNGTFELTEPPATLLARAERQATAAAREGRPDAARRLRRVMEALELIGSLDGSAEFCVRMPHRTRQPDTLDRQRWNDRLAERRFGLELELAEVLARSGQAREAMRVFGADEPELILSSTPSRRAILDLMRGPRVSTLRVEPDLELAPRPTFVDASARRESEVLPMRWIDSRRVILPRRTALQARLEALVERGTPPRARSAALAGAVVGLTYGRLMAPEPLSPVSHAILLGALRPGLPLRHAVEQGGIAARSVIASANRVAADMIGSRGIYAGARFPNLDVTTGRLDEDTAWEALQVYAPLVAPWDLSPSGSRLLVDDGLTCAGAFLQLCIGEPELCREGAPPPALGGPTTTSRDLDPSTTRLFELPGVRVRPCYPSEVPSALPDGTTFVGWLSDDRLVLRRDVDYYALEVALDGSVTRAERVEPRFPAPEADAAAPPASALGGLMPRILFEAAGGAPWPWLPKAAGAAERFEVVLDRHAVWLYDREIERDFLLALWSQLPISPPRGAWTAALSPDGRYLAIWIQGQGLWIGAVTGLPVEGSP